MKFKVNGNLPILIIEAKDESEAIINYLDETENNPIIVKLASDKDKTKYEVKKN